MPWLQNAMERMPILSELGIKRDVHGAISHPPDGNPLIGPAPGVQNYWCCCGTQIGIGWGPGLTRELARWMVHGSADISMRDYDPRRFGDYATKDWQVIKAREDYCLRHEIPFPHFNRTAGRPIKTNSLYQRLKEKNAVFEEVFGHERPRWFAGNEIAAEDQYSFRRNPVFDQVAAEVRAVRESAGIMDISAFTKIELSGAGVDAALDRLIANRLPTREGGIALTHLLNERGRIEIELTIVRLSPTRFYLVCAAFFEQRLLDHLHRYLGPALDDGIEIHNHSTAWSALALQGPRSGAILRTTTETPLELDSFPWFTAQTINVAGHSVWALRMSYAGEQGWELHGPDEAMLSVYDALVSSGQNHNLCDYGSFAMNVMRMEKGFKGAGELNNEVTLAEADVMRFVQLNKPDFVGKTATEKSLTQSLPWVCCYLSIQAKDNIDGHGGEAVLRDGLVVGSTGSVVYGHTVGTVLAFAYLSPDAAQPGTQLEVNIMGELRSAHVLENAAYDPDNLKPRSGLYV